MLFELAPQIYLEFLIQTPKMAPRNKERGKVLPAGMCMPAILCSSYVHPMSFLCSLYMHSFLCFCSLPGVQERDLHAICPRSPAKSCTTGASSTGTSSRYVLLLSLRQFEAAMLLSTSVLPANLVIHLQNTSTQTHRHARTHTHTNIHTHN